jgi:flagellar basal-body rod protein FlgG
MLRSLTTAALGMSAQQLNVDNIANNLANVNTTGYKKSTIEFQDLLYETINAGRGDGREGHEKPADIQVGLGNRAISTFRSFSQGNIEETGNPLDVAINGKGFFQVQRPDGSVVYTRDGALRVNSTGQLVNASGLLMHPEMSFPEGVTNISVSKDGTLMALLTGETEPIEVGQIELVSFVNPAGLRAIGGNLYEETEASGMPAFATPGQDGVGLVEQGFLEKSNVDVAQEMINLIVAQRAYEINSKAVKTADELLALTNNLKR